MAENRDEKINLRPIKISDIDDFMVWASDERVAHFCTWDSYTSRDEALHFLTNNAIPHPWFRAICAGDRAVGSISVTPGSGTRSCTAELGYVVAFEHWGKGVATEAVRIVASTIFRKWPLLQRLEALVDAENGRSQKVLEKAGFVREGLLRKYDVVKGKPRDMIVFSLLP
ncbi:hypothetical protein SASPL_103834 [Salvia splendens]|uniref:N-acetyltransferase domain-containing protein n=1 Tax=Salvia splendens TaxID=180675 RepID=A0A8X8YI55_SALSN|nr:uncharacterized N-acetyltransferase p20-like [Salvia splendens]KAG6432259.1 hypothetical protein SASPL_103834 [Salvia splendens]